MERNRGRGNIDKATTVSGGIEHIARTPNIDVIGIAPAWTRRDECCKVNDGRLTARRSMQCIGISNIAKDVYA
jgi:hypothetical protein